MDWILVLAGFAVGTLVGITGVGGGSVMTPFLLFYGIPPVVAVGSDLAYAAIAKTLGVWLRHRARSIDWRVALLLVLGSVPASLAVIAAMRVLSVDGGDFATLITSVLAVGLIGTAVTLLVYPWLQHSRRQMPELPGRAIITVIAGCVLGALVTLSSVGSGALGTALLLLLYPRWSAARVVGTDLAYAVPLTAAAALGHAYLGHVNWWYVASLVVGAVPGMYLGTNLGLNLRESYVRAALGVILLGVGVSFLFR
jgi:uncharacterized membrane protein YfcA